jgi:hypothetical protein
VLAVEHRSCFAFKIRIDLVLWKSFSFVDHYFHSSVSLSFLLLELWRQPVAQSYVFRQVSVFASEKLAEVFVRRAVVLPSSFKILLLLPLVDRRANRNHPKRNANLVPCINRLKLHLILRLLDLDNHLGMVYVGGSK